MFKKRVGMYFDVCPECSRRCGERVQRSFNVDRVLFTDYFTCTECLTVYKRSYKGELRKV